MLTTFALALVLTQADPLSKIHPGLQAAFADRPADTEYRVYAVHEERLSRQDLEAEGVTRHARGTRQRAVAQRLMSFADEKQAGIRSLLATLEEEGSVDRIEPLWITNSIVFHGNRRAIESIAALEEVERIGWDPARDHEEYWDVAPPRFTTYYAQDFEGGVMPAEFATTTTSCGMVQVTGSYSPHQGSYHCVMGSTTDNCASTATLTLTVDLTGVTTAKIRYALKDMGDEFDLGLDILEGSDDGGLSWVKIADITGSDGAYIYKNHDLDGLGFTYGAGFLVRWSWSDNYAPETDGFGIDVIEIADDFAPPPPPDPEPNLVQLQAEDLWDLGYKGAGSLIVNIDSGVDYNHPDLINRIWTNPLDPVNGIDDDGNGYIDDTMGWDFDGGDNDPMTSATHGTNTGGIMVGDGSAGLFQTGMAPEAQMAVCLVAGESHHWLALQWAISVGADCSSSSHSYKWAFSPQPDYHMHRQVSDMVLAAGMIHANSIGNQGGSSSYPIPFNISTPGNVPAPWTHFDQTDPAGVSGTMGCGAVRLDNSQYSYSGIGPAAWEDITTYEPSYPWPQDSSYWDYPYGGFGGGLQSLLKPDVVTYTEVVTTTNGGGYTTGFGGTSAATPHLGGALALLTSAAPYAEPRHICQALQRSAVDMGTPGKDNEYGAGRVAVLDAAKRLFHTVKADDTTPSLGSWLQFTVYGFPLDSFTCGFSLSLGTTVLPYATIDLAAPITILATSILDASGQYVMAPIPVPYSPAFIGLDVYVQSLSNNSSGITGGFLSSTVEQITIVP
jgi:subtilisin family serine protease